MARLKKRGRKRKPLAIVEDGYEPLVVDVNHDSCIIGGGKTSCVFFPIGYMYNKDIQRLRRGDIIRFLDKSEHYVESVVRTSINNALAHSLCRMIYGFGLKKALDVWWQRVEMQRLDRRVISDIECLVVFYLKEEVQYEI